EPDAEPCVLQHRIQLERAFERVLDPFPVTRCGETLAAEHSPLRDRRVRAGEVEPGFAVARSLSGPSFGRGVRSGCRRLEAAVQQPAVLVLLDLPPQRHFPEAVARWRAREAKNTLHRAGR